MNKPEDELLQARGEPGQSTEHTVGYKSPPLKTRFKPGQSGNLKGRPKKPKSITSVFEAELLRKVSITENGERKQITKLQAFMKQVVNKAASGDPRASRLMISMLSDLREAQAESFVSVPSRVSTEADLQVLASLKARLEETGSNNKEAEQPAEPDGEQP